MNYKIILDEIEKNYKKILSEKLVGMYVHGSIAFGCFKWNKSDIDFLVVTNKKPTLQEKIELIKTLQDLDDKAPKKGFEMSVVLEEYCNQFIYPTPFELHFSNAHKQNSKDNVREYCTYMNGTDKDLAAHFMVTKAVGLVWYGKAIESVFGDVERIYYLDSIKGDIANSKEEIVNNPVYIILNLCRVLAYIQVGKIFSKEQGGKWGIKYLPKRYSHVVLSALTCYCNDEELLLDLDIELVHEFVDYMLKKI